MNESIPVNPCVLKWARETGGFDIETVVSRIKQKKVNSSTVMAWEKGTQSPSYAQLEKLAYKIYKRPLAIFFFPSPPKEETPEQSFRTLPKEQIELLDPTLLKLIREAMVMQENLRDLFDETNPAKKHICKDIKIKPSSGQNVVQAAKTVRNYLGVSSDKQYKLKTADNALRFWRNLLEEHGVFVFKEAFKDEDCSGFCLYDTEFPIIYINNSQPKTRQIFTMFHELAHLLFGVGGVDLRYDGFIEDIQGDNKFVEVFCNKFSGEFLVPSDEINRLIGSSRIDENLIDTLSSKYSVSREVILRKCLDLGLITQDFYNRKVNIWVETFEYGKDVRSESGGNYYRTKGTYLGENYIDAAFSCYYQNKISRSQLADYLGVKIRNIPGMELLLFKPSGAV